MNCPAVKWNKAGSFTLCWLFSSAHQNSLSYLTVFVVAGLDEAAINELKSGPSSTTSVPRTTPPISTQMPKQQQQQGKLYRFNVFLEF